MHSACPAQHGSQPGLRAGASGRLGSRRGADAGHAVEGQQREGPGALGATAGAAGAAAARRVRGGGQRSAGAITCLCLPCRL